MLATTIVRTIHTTCWSLSLSRWRQGTKGIGADMIEDDDALIIDEALVELPELLARERV